MHSTFLKKTIVLNLLLLCSISVAQKKIDIRYYINNTQYPIEEISVYLITKSDTLSPKIENGKIQLVKNMEDNFSLMANIKGNILKIGSYRPKDFDKIDAIAIGRITDFSVLKKSWENNDTFTIDKEYSIMIPGSNSIADVVYGIIRKDVDVSRISNFAKYYPTYSGTYEVVKRN